VSVAYRRVQDEVSPRPVALIVICDACGNRELAWAWHDDGVVKWWALEAAFIHQKWWLPEPKPPVERDTEVLREALRRFRRSSTKEEQRRLRRASPPVVLEGRARYTARCPHHGDLFTPEISPADLDPTTTLKIRVIRSTA
jgi:hypothetical protein